MSAESDSHPMDQEQPETHYSNSHPPESEDNPLPKTNRLKRLGRKKEQPQSEDEREPLELKESQEEEISILDILILTAALYTDEPVSKPKKKKKNLDKLAAKRRAELEKEKEDEDDHEKSESKYDEIKSSGQLDIVLNRKNRGKQPKVEEINGMIDELTSKKGRSKKNREMVMTTMSTLQQLDEGVYTREEEDDNSRDRQLRYEAAMETLEKSERVRDVGRKKKNGGTTVKTRNKLFGEFNQQDFLNEENENEVFEEQYVDENIERIKNDKKKDGTQIFKNVEKFKIEKLRLAPQKSQSTVMEKQTSRVLERQPSQKDSSNSNGKFELAAPPSLTQIESIPSSAPEEIPMHRAKSIDFRSILSQSKNSMSIDNADRLLDIDVSVPHLAKQPSQSLTENTIFMGHLIKTNTIVDKTTIKAHHSHSNPREYKSLTAIANDLRKKIREKRSKNITLEIIQSRFQATELENLESKKKKSSENNKGNRNEDEEDSENDSDFIPEDAKEDIVTDPNAIEKDGPIPIPSIFTEPKASQEGKTSKPKVIKKPLGIDDIKRLEEGEEEEDDDDISGKDDREGSDDDMFSEEASDVEEEITTNNASGTQGNGGLANENSNTSASKRNIEKIKKAQETFDNEIHPEYDQPDETFTKDQSHKRIKRLGDKIIETLRKREQEEAERKRQKELKRQERERMKSKLSGYMEVEAEVGSDHEENDDITKQIDKKDAGENEDGLDEDLAELFDYGFTEGEGGDPEALRKYLEDLRQDDREKLKKVMQRGFANKKRRRQEFEYNLGDEEERLRRKAIRMEEAIKLLEENDKTRFNSEAKANTIQEDDDDLFDDEAAVKRFQLDKATTHVRKNIDKKLPSKKKEISLFQTDDEELMKLMKTIDKTGGSQKPADMQKSTSLGETKKPATTLMRMGTMSKNSVLDVRQNQKNISLYNKQYNKDVLNEYGAKTGVLALLTKEDQSNSINKSRSVHEHSASSSLNKLFTPNSDLKGKVLAPSNNAIPFFKQRTKKEN